MVGTSWINILVGAWMTLAPWALTFGGRPASNTMLFGMLPNIQISGPVLVSPVNAV